MNAHFPCSDCGKETHIEKMWIVDHGVMCVPCFEAKNKEQAKKVSSCWHTWKLYIGFTDKFEFCTRCGDKRR